tara:strand:- start:207 stop:620 length:414 start_codon:yes stop_codon:yes gene_type:complete
MNRIKYYIGFYLLMKNANPYPMMFSHQYLPGDHIPKVPDLDECYKGQSYQYFSKEEHFYNDSNFYGNPFEEEEKDYEDFNPIRRSSSHELLGVDPDCSEKEIKQAFFKRARETHPDKIGGDGEEFKKVREAYECLIS